MNIIEKMKQFFSGKMTEEYKNKLLLMNSKLNSLKLDYEKLLEYKNQFEINPKNIFSVNFEKKEKYIDEMQEIQFKDIQVFKEYELIAMKYNILVELFARLKSMISEYNNCFLKFDFDDFNQPIAILSQVNNNLHKIILIKNTIKNCEYISFVVDDYISIVEFGPFQEISHFELLMKMISKSNSNKLFKVSEDYLESFPKQIKGIIQNSIYCIVV